MSGGAPQRRHGALLEPLAQLGDTLECVGAVAIPVKAAELVLLQTAQVGSVAVSMGADTKANTLLGGGALERGHGAALERLAQLDDALRSVGAVAFEVEAAELVRLQTAQVGSGSVNGR